MTDLPTLTPTVTPDDVTTPVDVDQGEHEMNSHIINTPKGVSAEAIILEARVSGIPIRALCGKMWVPQRDPGKFPVCPTCIERFEALTGKPWTGRR